MGPIGLATSSLDQRLEGSWKPKTLGTIHSPQLGPPRWSSLSSLMLDTGTHIQSKANSVPLLQKRSAPSPRRLARLPYPTSTSPSHNGRETLGLRPALRQAAPVCRQRLRRRGASSTRRRGSGFGQSHDKPPSGDSLREFVLHSLRLHPSGLGGAACLRDIPCGNVVSRWTLAAIGAQYSSQYIPWSQTYWPLSILLSSISSHSEIPDANTSPCTPASGTWTIWP